jgi:hypothetical protein
MTPQVNEIRENDDTLSKADIAVLNKVYNLYTPHPHIKVLNYIEEKGDTLPYIKISHDFSKILFCSDR